MARYVTRIRNESRDDIVKKITESSLQQLSTVIQSISATNGGHENSDLIITDVACDAIKRITSKMYLKISNWGI